MVDKNGVEQLFTKGSSILPTESNTPEQDIMKMMTTARYPILRHPVINRFVTETGMMIHLPKTPTQLPPTFEETVTEEKEIIVKKYTVGPCNGFVIIRSRRYSEMPITK